MNNNNIEQLAEHATQQTVLLIMERMKDQSITVKCPESYRLGLEVALNQLHMSFYGIFKSTGGA